MSKNIVIIVFLTHLLSCASQRGKFYEGETLPPDRVAAVMIQKLESYPVTIPTMVVDVKVGENQLSPFNKEYYGYFKPGDYEFKLTSGWWDHESHLKNSVRGIAFAPCLLGFSVPYPFLPIAITCIVLAPDKQCESEWNMRLEAGKKYTVDVDWISDPPHVKVNEASQEEEVFSKKCDIKIKGQSQ